MQVIGISKDPVEVNATFAQKYRFPFPLLSDTGGQVCRAYGSCTESGEVTRNTFIVSPDGKIRHIFEDVEPEGHAEAVLALLEAEAAAVSRKRDSVPGSKLVEGQGPSAKGRQEKMDDQQHIENGAVGEAETLNQPDVPLEELLEGEAEAVAPAAPTPSKVAAARTALLSEPLPASSPGQVQPAQSADRPRLVFALGTLGYDFGTEARRDSIAQDMVGPDNPAANPHDPAQLLAYLEANPDQAAAVIWTLSLDATPIYAVMPRGPFAAAGYERLRQFLREQLEEGVERVSIASVIVGQVQLMSGQRVPLISPELRCMYSWTTEALVEAVAGEPPDDSADREAYGETVEAVANFLERVYYELRNLGATPQDRALNYAATNAMTAAGIFEAALQAEMELDTIEVERSPICRPDSECWDVVLCFFDPENVLRSRKCHRLTVDVSDVCPVMVSKVRSWSMR